MAIVLPPGIRNFCFAGLGGLTGSVTEDVINTGATAAWPCSPELNKRFLKKRAVAWTLWFTSRIRSPGSPIKDSGAPRV